MKWKDNEKHYPQHLKDSVEKAKQSWDFGTLFSINTALGYMEHAEPTVMEQRTIAKMRADVSFATARLAGIFSTLENMLQTEVLNIYNQENNK